ncbi:pyridoxal phosphate-dependent transferase [Dendryphion nanum]|uniref:Pyridoxal phosphate-dependent transferase n=1 Tax=Dendryphion nanum TaxID=256645 RepID=A0A9P9DBK5_9PLEO|nr:pyridoxal phosphate-dependent transferase [Dendryphion nanum]
MSRIPSGLWHNLIAVQIYGANTGVGKTVASTLLGAHFRKRTSGKIKKWSVKYLKPVSTGPMTEMDELYVKRFTGASVSTLFKYNDAVSPHIAAANAGRNGKYIPPDAVVNERLYTKLKGLHAGYSMAKGEMGIAFVETAGGVLSPGPSGTPQADIYRQLRLPVVLVGDHRLGGIASTISAAESLIIRGYDIEAVVCFNDKSKYQNHEYLGDYFMKRNIPLYSIPWIPDLKDLSEEQEVEKMREYYTEQCDGINVSRLSKTLIDKHFKRLTAIKNMAEQTHSVIWHPFTQHKHVKDHEDIMVFDSAYGDFFQTKYTPKTFHSIEHKAEAPMLFPAFDGSASWWTQGLGHGNPELSLAAAYAAGRYGHVMFAGATHEPALTLAQTLLEELENPRLKKAFYTDDGSTALEVGIKMALRATCKRYEWDGSKEDIGIIGLKGSYHGDTIGAMDASEPCVYNKKVDWYRGRGYWFDFPTVKMRKERWVIEAPAGMEEEFGPAQYFDDLNEIFDVNNRSHSPRYEAYITRILDDLVKTQGRKFGALVMEPIILGAGGMIFVDPLFQRTLVNVIRTYPFTTLPSSPKSAETWTGLPVIFDEVFTGLYRLGRFSAASFLQIHPDISCHAKLLTGGLLPLSVTLASESIFDAFYGDEKADALLHGHSYTAHPIGCHVANVSLSKMKELETSYTWRGYMKGWVRSSKNAPVEQGFKIRAREAEDEEGKKQDIKATWSMWSKKTVLELSQHSRVDSVIALGSVLAITLKDNSGAGYTSQAAVGLRDLLLNGTGKTDMRIHSRVLGNVLYLMASMTSKAAQLEVVEKTLMSTLNSPAMDLETTTFGR